MGNLLYRERRIVKYLNLLVGGIFIYQVSDLFYQYIYVNGKIFRITSAIGIALMLYGFIRLPKKCIYNKKIKYIYYFFVLVNLITIFRGIFTPMPLPTKMLIFDYTYLWQFIIPLFGLLVVEKIYIQYIIKWCYIYAIVSILFALYNYSDFYFNASYLLKNMMNWEGYIVNRPQVPAYFIFPLCIFIFYFSHFKINMKYIFIISIILAVIAALMSGRRSAAATVLIYVLVGMIYFYKNHKAILIATLLCFFLILHTNNTTIDKINIAGNFEILNERLTQDTRSDTEKDFYKDMDQTSIIFGRGINGTYKSPSVAIIDKLNRTCIETGYLNIILHGGIILLIPYIILLLNSAYKGFLHSNNSLCKVFAFYCLYSIFWLYPGGILSLDIQNLILWIAIAVCQSSKWRKYSENEIILFI